MCPRLVHSHAVPKDIVTAAELEKLTPAERRALFEASIVTNLDRAPQILAERARARAKQLIAESDLTSRVSVERREVRATINFFRDLDRQVRAERGPNGELATSDFPVFELLEIVEKFALALTICPH